MKLIASGVANWAAIVRSPSFSRFSSSQTTTIRPRRISSIASSIVANDCRARSRSRSSQVILRFLLRSKPCRSRSDVAGDHVHLEVDPVALDRASPSVVRSSVSGISDTSNQSGVERGDRQADAVDGDRAVLDDVALRARPGPRPARGGRSRPRSTRAHLADAVDVALDDVAAERLAGPQRGLEVDRGRRLELAERGQRRASGSSRRPRSRRRRGDVDGQADARRPRPSRPRASSPAKPGARSQPRAVVVALDRLDRCRSR